jgi:hypothetical protein
LKSDIKIGLESTHTQNLDKSFNLRQSNKLQRFETANINTRGQEDRQLILEKSTFSNDNSFL